MDKVSHFEIPADDMARAKDFYTSVFGWNANESDGYTMVHTVATDERGMAKDPGGINGGITPRDDTAKAPIVVVEVKNIEETIRKAESMGGKVAVLKTTVAGGRLYYARITDSEGNIVGIVQYAML